MATPPEIITRLHAEVLKVLNNRDVVQVLNKAGFEVRTSTPEQCAAFTRIEVEKWAKVVKAANMRAD
jgi:tripartite-type tricarboxylate transporter receptor subunit TctC